MRSSQQKRGRVGTRTSDLALAGRVCPHLGQGGGQAARGWSGIAGSWTRAIRASPCLLLPLRKKEVQPLSLTLEINLLELASLGVGGGLALSLVTTALLPSQRVLEWGAGWRLLQKHLPASRMSLQQLSPTLNPVRPREAFQRDQASIL